jgi:hypothetical protein
MIFRIVFLCNGHETSHLGIPVHRPKLAILLIDREILTRPMKYCGICETSVKSTLPVENRSCLAPEFFNLEHKRPKFLSSFAISK